MEKGDEEKQPMGLCHRLFNFLKRNISGQGLKRVTLGAPKGHGLSQEPVFSATKPIGEAIVPIPLREKPKNNTNMPIHIEFEKSNGFGNSANIMEKGSAIVGDNQTQLHDSFNIGSGLPSRTIPVKDHSSKHKPNDLMGGVRNDNVGISSSESLEKKDKRLEEVIVPLKGNTEEKERDMANKDDNLSKEKMKQAIEQETDVKMTPRQSKPVWRSVSNINEKSEAFIRRTKESLRNSTNIEPKSSS